MKKSTIGARKMSPHKKTPLNIRITNSVRIFALGWLFVCAAVSGEELSFGELRTMLMSEVALAGEFTQCDKQKTTTVSANGRFYLQPGRRVQLDYVAPKLFTVELLKRNGAVIVKTDGALQKSNRMTTYGAMIFALINLDETALRKKFKIDVQGSVKRFSITFIPNKRTRRVMQLMELSGADGMINTVRLALKGGRTLTLGFFQPDERNHAPC